MQLLNRVGQFFQVSPTVPLLCRVFHPDSKNGLFSALRRILNLRSVPDGKSVFWPFLALRALHHFFSLSTWKYKQNTSFGSRSFIPKLLRPAFSFESPGKKAKLWTHCASWLIVLNKKKGHFWNQHEKLHRLKDGVKETLGNWPTLLMISFCSRKVWCWPQIFWLCLWL